MSSTRQTDKLNMPAPGTLIIARDGSEVAIVLSVEPAPGFFGARFPDE